MEESLENSAQNGKRSTRKTAKLTLDQRLQIIEDSLLAYQRDGGSTSMIPTFYDHGRRAVVIMLYECQVEGGHLVPISAQGEEASADTGTGEKPQ